MRFAILAITLCLLGGSVLSQGESITVEAVTGFSKDKNAVVVLSEYELPLKDNVQHLGNIDLRFGNLAKATNPEEIEAAGYIQYSEDKEHKEWTETKLELQVKNFKAIDAEGLKNAFLFISTDDKQIALNHEKFDNFEGPIIWGTFSGEVPAFQQEKGTFYVIFNEPEEIEAKRRLTREERRFRRMLRRNRRKYGNLLKTGQPSSSDDSTDAADTEEIEEENPSGDSPGDGSGNSNNNIKGRPRLTREERRRRRRERRRRRRIRRGLDFEPYDEPYQAVWWNHAG